MNQIFVIRPYRLRPGGVYVFDDEARGLKQEVFVSDTTMAIDLMRAVQEVGSEFELVFSADPFRGHQYCVNRKASEYGGTVYEQRDLEIEGWLCPALLRYFPEPPEHLYLQFREIGAQLCTGT